MLNIKDTSTNSTAELLEKAIDAAFAFGFRPLEEILSEKPAKRLQAANSVTHVHKKEKVFAPTIRKLLARDIQETREHILSYELNMSVTSRDSFSLNIANTENPLAEAALIATTYTLLDSVGVQDAVVHINSFGTSDSFTRYMRDLTKFLKKISKDTSIQIQSDLTVSPMRAYARLCKIDKDIVCSGPMAVDYLNDEGRSHLWGLLEYLEGAGIPYVLDNTVVAGTDYFEQTIFEIKKKNTNSIIAYGGRYSILGRKAYKKHLPIAGITIDIAGNGARKVKKLPSHKDTKFYFAQLGERAKRAGLKILRLLHNAGIRVAHNLTQEELTRQMSKESLDNYPYVIIIGQKEALDNTVIIRDTSTHKQKAVPADKLISYLKKL